MLGLIPRHVLAVLFALFVASSVAATPVAASTISDTTLSDGDLSTNLDSDGTNGDETDGEGDGDTDDTDEDSDDGGDDESDDWSLYESDGDDGSDDDGSNDDGSNDDGSDADDGATETDDSDDDTVTGGESDADGGSSAADTDRERSESGLASGTADAAGEAADRPRVDLVAASVGDTASTTGYTGDGPDDAAASAADLADDAVVRDGSVDVTEPIDVGETVDGDEVDSTLALSIGLLELRLDAESLTVATGVDVGAEDPSSAVVETAAAPAAGAGAYDAAGTPAERSPTWAGAGPGEGGEPEPAPTGAVMAVGALLAVAAVRHTPFVASGGAQVATSTGPSLLSTLLEKVRPFVLPLRYSRYDDSDPLEHEAREQVYELVNEAPGSYLSEVSEEADLPLSTTRHHIKILEREQLVSGVKLRGKRRFYPAYAEGIELAAALNDDSTATIIDAIARFGAASVSDLAEELGRDPSTVSHHLQRLEEDDIVTRERDGRAVVTRLSSEARTALEPESTPTPGEASEALAGGAD